MPALDGECTWFSVMGRNMMDNQVNLALPHRAQTWPSQEKRSVPRGCGLRSPGWEAFRTPPSSIVTDQDLLSVAQAQDQVPTADNLLYVSHVLLDCFTAASCCCQSPLPVICLTLKHHVLSSFMSRPSTPEIAKVSCHLLLNLV